MVTPIHSWQEYKMIQSIPSESLLAIASKFEDAGNCDPTVPCLDTYSRETLVYVYM